MKRSRERLFDLVEQAHAGNQAVPLEMIQEDVAAAIREVRTADLPPAEQSTPTVRPECTP